MHIYTAVDIDAFARVRFAPTFDQAAAYEVLEPVKQRFLDAEKDEKITFRSTLVEYVRLYAFLSQILPFADAALEKLYVFGRDVLKHPDFRIPGDRLPLEVQQQIDMDSYRVKKTSSGDIGLRRGKAELPPVKAAEALAAGEDKVEPLSRIIKDLNDRFGTDFSDQDKDSLAQLEARLDEEPALKASIEVNVPENARLTFDHVARDKFQEMVDSNFKLYKQVTDNEDFAGLLFQWLFDRYRQRARGA
jgi:type I restriction enzyme R subunit